MINIFTSVKFVYVITRGNHKLEMTLLKYLSVKNPPAALPTKVSSLSVNELQAANSFRK